MEKALRIMVQPMLKGAGKINPTLSSWKRELIIWYGKNLLYHMQKGVLFEVFRDLQPKETIRRVHWKTISCNSENFLLFHTSESNWSQSSTEVLLKMLSLGGPFICITLTFVNMNVLIFQFNCLKSSILHYSRGPTVSEAITWDCT